MDEDYEAVHVPSAPSIELPSHGADLDIPFSELETMH